MSAERKPEVFISYSHQDEELKNKLVTHLRALEHQEGLYKVWHDRAIGVGEDWEEKISEALRRAQIAVLLVTANFLTSDFIKNEELRVILERRRDDLVVLPVIATECPWRRVTWLARLNVFKRGTPVWEEGTASHVNTDLQELTDLVAEHAERLTAALSPSAESEPAGRASVLFISDREPEEEPRASALRTFIRLRGMLAGARKRAAQPGDELLLLGAVRGALSGQPEEEARKLICYAKSDGVVVATFDDPQALVRFAADASPRLKAQFPRCLRMGLHSEAATAETLNDLSGVPRRGVDVARRVMMLGRCGHFLSTGAAEAQARVNAETGPAVPDSLFHLAGKLEVYPNRPEPVYNVYGDGLGVSSPPMQRVPDRVLVRKRIPRTLKELKKETVKLSFRPDLPYVKVQIKFESPRSSEARRSRIEVECEEKPDTGDCTYEYDFDDLHDAREQKFGVTLLDIGGERTANAQLFFRDRYGELCARPVRQAVTLHRYYLAWLLDRIRFAPAYVKASVVAVILLAGAWYQFPRLKEPLMRALFWPEEFSDVWPTEDFLLHDYPWSGRWEVKGGSIDKEKGDNKHYADDYALLFTGPGMVVAKGLGEKRLYDFNAHFRVGFKPPAARAGWIFRAQDDGKSGYVFFLERGDENTLLLKGFIYTGGKLEPFDNIPRPININGCCDPFDRFDVEATVKGYTFTFAVTVMNMVNRQSDKSFPLTYKPKVPFKDERGRHYRYGNVGFFEEHGEQMSAQNWELTVLPTFAAAPDVSPAASR